MYNKIKRKIRFNRLTRFLRFKDRISALEACTYWQKANKNKFYYKNDNPNIFNLNITAIDGKKLPLALSWANPIITRPRFLYSFNNVIISPNDSHVYFYEINRLSSDLGSKFDSNMLSVFDFYGKNELLNSKEINGDILHLGFSSNSKNFYHWIHEIYSRIIRVMDEYDINKFKYIIMPKVDLKFQKEALDLLKIDLRKILSEDQFYNCKGNLITLNIDSIASGIDIRNFFLKRREKKEIIYRKYFLDRDSNSGSQKRELINFDKFREKYVKAGFQFIKPERLSFKDQIDLFLSAKSLVGVNGSSFSLASLMPRGSKVVELFPKNFIDPAISNICAASNLKYGFYVEDSFRPLSEKDWYRDANSKINAELIDHDKVIDFLNNEY